MNSNSPLVSLSVVSHGQSSLIADLLADLDRFADLHFEVVITVNIPEDETVYEGRPYPVTIIRNPRPKGFGCNHNTAFNHSQGVFFAVVNPDIRIPALDLDRLLQPFVQPRVGAVSPVIRSPEGSIEDSVRRFPTVARFVRRLLLRQRSPDYLWDKHPIEVDWAAGMFVIFRHEAFHQLGGFDDKRFFMYMEDVDICERLWHKGWAVLLHPEISVIHAAQRASRRNMRHMRWHITSAIRYLTRL